MTVNNVNALLAYTANQNVQTAAKTEEAVKEGLIDEVGGIKEALKKLHEMME